MAKNDAASLIESLIGDLGGASKSLRKTQKKVDDFVKELTKAKEDDAANLQKLVQRRQQLFDTINAIVQKFDESTKKVIQKLGQG